MAMGPNQSLLDGNNRVEENILVGDMNLPTENGLTSNGDRADFRGGLSGSTQNQAAHQVPQQQQPPQNPIVHWERFLHLRSLKVLLVENDDSTRHVVSALLRNCSYEVTEAANALQAWKVLEDLTNHIDLVLTEVSMPYISGIVLLSKIMSHKTRKNVPVIMMSSHDSMGLVFKCLSKGAVDFLVKPIRKNELKNLWQHVWRRCHSSSGSGSESGTQSQKSVKSKSIELSGNSPGSTEEEDNGSTGLNMGDGSDSGSGTQSSWTKQAAQIDSPKPSALWNHMAECADSTCAQVIHSNAETSQNKQVPGNAVVKCNEVDEQQENVVAGTEFEQKLAGNIDPRIEHPMDALLRTKGSKEKNLLEEIDRGHVPYSGSLSSKVNKDTTCLIGNVVNADSHTGSREFEGPHRISSVSDTNNAENLPSLELSLKRLRNVKDMGPASKDDRNVLRRSDSSAFSRYNTSLTSQKNPSGITENGLGEINLRTKEKDLRNSLSNGDLPDQCSNWASNNNDMGSIADGPETKLSLMRSNSAVAPTTNCLHPSSSSHLLKSDLAFPQKPAHEKADEKTGTATASPVQMQDLHHHHHHEKQASDHNDISPKFLAAPAPYCGSSNVLGGPVEVYAGNYSVNGSASGSNHGSNGPNGSSVAANAGAMNMESDNGDAEKSGSANGSGSGSWSGSGGTENNRMDQDKFAQREAALRKFRLKRSERCFRKKVRYQSRKRLAEQRSRVRGQFVRKSAEDNTSEATNNS